MFKIPGNYIQSSWGYCLLSVFFFIKKVITFEKCHKIP